MSKSIRSITVTRNGDQFTYQHKMDSEPTDVSLRDVFIAANEIIQAKDRAADALSFLHQSLEAIANQGKSLDECGVRGVAAICDIISDSLILNYEDRGAENSIIKEMAQTMEYQHPDRRADQKQAA